MSAIAMSLEGMLTDCPPSGNLLNYEANDVGRKTFNLLKLDNRIVLLCSDPYEERVKAWLAQERMSGYAMIYCKPVLHEDPRGWRIEKLTDLMGIGHHFAYYVDTDPTTVAMAMDVGINGLLLGLPHTYPGQEKGPENPSPWYSLVRRVDEQNALRAKRAQEESERDPTAAPS